MFTKLTTFSDKSRESDIDTSVVCIVNSVKESYILGTKNILMNLRKS